MEALQERERRGEGREGGGPRLMLMIDIERGGDETIQDETRRGSITIRAAAASGSLSSRP